jgi:orotidine-5'-phosphate decarboxylase
MLGAGSIKSGLKSSMGIKMKKAKDYIIFPLDVPTLKEAKPYISLLSSHVGMFKVGLELFIRSGPEVIRYIKSESSAGIFLDLKLHDIPVTVERAMRSVAELGVDLATIHCGESSAMMVAAVSGGGGRVRVLGVTVLTSVSGKDLIAAGFDMDLAELVVKRATMAKAAGLSGTVCSGLEVKKIKDACGGDFLCVTPGIRPSWENVGKDDQQRVCTPAGAIQNGADYLVIGRPIRDAVDPRNAAKLIAQEIDNGLNIRSH